MSAPSLQGASIEQHYPTGLQREVRMSAAATATGGRAVLAALAAAEVAEQPAAELDQFLDELAGLLPCPITGYQREKLQATLIGAIDARFSTLLGQLPA
ncbi:MAG TPA: hypothetical protein VFU36_05580 [Jatrophihabitans sp.]|nr:hypothetical protein [Jatrophihabitans sp.]